MELFAKIVDGLKPLTIFTRKASEMPDRVLNTPLKCSHVRDTVSKAATRGIL